MSNLIPRARFEQRRRTRRQIEAHVDEIFAENSDDAALDPILKIRCHGFPCEDCGHTHAGEARAYICVGCPCERTTPKGLYL